MGLDAEPHADHPRIRGEHAGEGVDPREGGGSSPHTRGAPGLRSTPGFPVGIIPAYAGSTGVADGMCTRMVDHPRIRGEHMHVYPPAHRFDGSSPHTRGALLAAVDVDGGGRIIPAYAGSTSVPGAFPPCCTDHPRIRGEHVRCIPLLFLSSGIIPAYAGSTAGGVTDYKNGTGSSPHTRGAPLHKNGLVVFSRIIPAYAGSTSR